MNPKRYTMDQIISNLQKVEIMRNGGMTIAKAVNEIGITDTTYYKWRKKYRGMIESEESRLKKLEKENARLKKLVADLLFEGRGNS